MQTYLQKYLDYDAQRLQKGQLAAIHLGGPPLLCRHFLPAKAADGGESGTTTPGQTKYQANDQTHLAGVVKPPCYRKQSDSSLEEHEKRTPLLDKVTLELDEASTTLDQAVSKSQDIMRQQDEAKDKINDIVDLANSVEGLIGGEVFQQVREHVPPHTG